MASSRDDLCHLFFVEAKPFIEQCPRVKGVRFSIVQHHFEPVVEFRDLAWYDPADHTVYVLDRLRSFARDTQVGIMRHELAHAADPDLAKPGAERRADEISELVTGVPMRYDQNDIQNAAQGRVGRPAYLPG